MELAFSAADFGLLLFISGALAIYVEFLRPGLVLPGAGGAALLTVALAHFAKVPPPLAALFLLSGALACFLLAIRIRRAHFAVFAGAIFLAAALAAISSSITAILLGIPFAGVTGFLLNIAIRARRNKSVAF